MVQRKTLTVCTLLLLTLACSWLTTPVAQADQYGLPALGQDGYYAALSTYVQFLAGRRGQAANASQRQTFWNRLGEARVNAANQMVARSNQRVAVSWGWNRDALNGAVASLQSDFNNDKASALADYADSVASAQSDRDSQLKDLQGTLNDAVAGINSNLQDTLNNALSIASTPTAPSKKCRFAHQAARHARHRFGPKAKKTKQAYKLARHYCGSSSSAPSDSAAAKQQAQEDIAAAQADFNQQKDDLDNTLAETSQNAAAQRDGVIQQLTDQLNADVGAATNEANQSWSDTNAQLGGVYTSEANAVQALYNQGSNYINNYPH